MEINVTATKLKLIKKSNLNKGEYNINSCNFNFSEEYEDLVKMAVFSNTKAAYKVVISNNTCAIPIEVLEETGVFELGVYGYSLTEINGEEVLEKRYSPTPIQIVVNYGSYKANANNSETPTATEYEQYVELLNEGLVGVQKIDITAEKVGKIATITITDKNGITKEIEISDGNDGANGADGKDR